MNTSLYNIKEKEKSKERNELVNRFIGNQYDPDKIQLDNDFLPSNLTHNSNAISNNLKFLRESEES